MTNPNNDAVFPASDVCEVAQPGATVGKLAHASRTHGAPVQTRFAFTPKALDALKCKTGRMEFWDVLTPGLGLRVTAEKKSWSFMFTARDGGRARLSLGTYPATPLDEARKRAVAAKGLVEAGKDPREVEAPQEITIAQLVDERVRKELRKDAGNFKWTCLETERCYDVDVIPVVGKVLVKDFRIRHLKLVLEPILDRGCNRQANIVHQHVTALLAFAVREGHIELDPLSAAKPPVKNVAKERFLTLPEVTALWTGAPDVLFQSPSAVAALQLVLATLQRPGEVLGMERADVNLAERVWIIPAHKAKNKHEHWVPLNDLAVAIISERLRLTNGDFLFPDRAGDGSIPNYTLATTLARALEPQEESAMPLGRLGIAKFTPHDLRRTGATHMSLEENGLQIDELHIAHVLNHRSVTKATVTARVYNQNQYLPEKRAALAKWGDFLGRLVGADQMLRAA